jgi:hypothetical protein
MRKLLVVLMAVISLAACSSNQVAESGCKFVNGAHESEQERKKQSERNGEKHERNDVDIMNGILALFAINVSDKEEKCI